MIKLFGFLVKVIGKFINGIFLGFISYSRFFIVVKNINFTIGYLV